MAKNLPDLEQLIEEWAPRIRQAFLEAVAKLGDRVQVGVLVDMISKGDIDGAIKAVGLDPAAMRPVDSAISQAFEAGGTVVADAIPATVQDGHRVKIMFNARNLRAEAWLRTHSSKLVRDVIEDQKQVIRDHLTAGMAKGQNPKTVALELVGKINPVTKKREGGALGLTASQLKWVQAYETELKTGDRAALKRVLRDRRFDKSVLKAIKDGKPLSSEKVASMVTAYKSRALKYRAETLARTEAMASLHQSQNESIEQAIEKGQIQAEDVTKTWATAKDTRVRFTHKGMEGQTVGFRAYFVSPSGAKLKFPGDPDAPPEERCNCRCTMSTKIDFLAKAARGEAA